MPNLYHTLSESTCQKLVEAILAERNKPSSFVVMKEDIERRLNGKLSKSRRLTLRTRFLRYHAEKAFDLRKSGSSYREIADSLRFPITGKYVRELLTVWVKSQATGETLEQQLEILKNRKRK